MSVFKNSIYSYEKPSDSSYGSLTYSNTNYYKKKIENNNTLSNNNVNSVDYITIPKSGSEREHSTYLFWTMVVLLFIFALGNLILILVMLSVLRLGQGMESLELVSDESLIKFFGNIDLDNIYKRDGKLESFNESAMVILGDVGNIYMSIKDQEKEPTINFGLNGMTIKNVESVVLKHQITGETIFSTDFPNFGLPRGVDKLDVETALSKRVSSAVDEDLVIKSDTYVKVKGSEGVHMDGKEAIWSADQDIFLKSVNRSIILNGSDGVLIDVRNIPIATKEKENRSQTQYKMCVCMPEGKLFMLPIPPGQNSAISCNNFDKSSVHNPCI